MDQSEHDPNLDFIVTFGHRSAYSSGYHPGDLILKQYLDCIASHRKDVLNGNGHSHNYEPSYPQHGVVHITVGTDGSELEESEAPCLFRVYPTPSWSAYRGMHFGVLTLHLTRREISGEFVCGPGVVERTTSRKRGGSPHPASAPGGWPPSNSPFSAL